MDLPILPGRILWFRDHAVSATEQREFPVVVLGNVVYGEVMACEIHWFRNSHQCRKYLRLCTLCEPTNKYSANPKGHHQLHDNRCLPVTVVRGNPLPKRSYINPDLRRLVPCWALRPLYGGKAEGCITPAGLLMITSGISVETPTPRASVATAPEVSCEDPRQDLDRNGDHTAMEEELALSRLQSQTQPVAYDPLQDPHQDGDHSATEEPALSSLQSQSQPVTYDYWLVDLFSLQLLSVNRRGRAKMRLRRDSFIVRVPVTRSRARRTWDFVRHYKCSWVIALLVVGMGVLIKLIT